MSNVSSNTCSIHWQFVYWQEQDTFLWAYDDFFVLPVDRDQHIELDFIECMLTKRTVCSLQVVFVTDPIFSLTPWCFRLILLVAEDQQLPMFLSFVWPIASGYKRDKIFQTQGERTF